MEIYYTTLQQSASSHVKSVNSFFATYPDLGSIIDKSRMTLLLELICHTITRYNHISNIREQVFKSAHRPLKFYISSTTSTNSHVYSVHMIQAKDWLQRISALWHLHVNKLETEKERNMHL